MAVVQSRPSMQPPFTATTFLPCEDSTSSQQGTYASGRQPLTYRSCVDQSSPALLAKVTAQASPSDVGFSVRLPLSCRHTRTVFGPKRLASCDHSTVSLTAPHRHRADSDVLVTAQQLRVRQRKPGEDGRGPKCRARLALALVAVANIQCQRLRGWCLEADSSALAAGVHVGGDAQAKRCHTRKGQNQKDKKRERKQRTRWLFLLKPTFAQTSQFMGTSCSCSRRASYGCPCRRLHGVRPSSGPPDKAADRVGTGRRRGVAAN